MTRHYINDCPCGEQHEPRAGLFIHANPLDDVDVGVDEEEILDELDRLRARARRSDAIAVAVFAVLFVVTMLAFGCGTSSVPDAPQPLPDANCGASIGAPCCAGARCVGDLECRDFAVGAVCCDPAAPIGECS